MNNYSESKKCRIDYVLSYNLPRALPDLQSDQSIELISKNFDGER